MKVVVQLMTGVGLALAAQAAVAQPETASLTPFVTLDVNGDGALSRSELTRQPELSRSFERMDTDRDGTLSAFEFDTPRTGASGIRPEPGITRR